MVNEVLREDTRVKSLDLRGCNIRADGAMALAALLTHNRTLTFLGLEWNGVGMLETGVQALCKALATNPSITEVDLRNNSIGPSGGAAIGAMLGSNTAIRRLDLRWNNLGVNGGDARPIRAQPLRVAAAIARCAAGSASAPPPAVIITWVALAAWAQARKSAMPTETSRVGGHCLVHAARSG